jgi:DNA-binding transcriptional LysR family regulator
MIMGWLPPHVPSSTGGCEPIIAGAARAAGARLKVVFEAREVTTVIAMVESGLGVSVVPALALPSRHEALAARSLDPPVSRHIGLGVRSPADASPAARAFLELAVAYSAATPVSPLPST